MTTTELLAAFANPETMAALSISEKLYAGIVTTVLGMGITFSALIILQFVIAWMEKILTSSRKPEAAVSPGVQPAAQSATGAAARGNDDGELIAAISTALAMTLKTSASNIVIRNIEKIDHHAPQWHNAGIIEQMNNRM